MSLPAAPLIDLVRHLSRTVPRWVSTRIALLTLELQLNVRRLYLIVALGALTGLLLFGAWVCACAVTVIAIVSLGVPWHGAMLGLLGISLALAFVIAVLAVRITSGIRFSPLALPAQPQPPRLPDSEPQVRPHSTSEV